MRIRASDDLGPAPTTILEVIVGSTVHGIVVRDGLEELDLKKMAGDEFLRRLLALNRERAA